MTTVQDTSRFSYRGQEQGIRKISEDLVGQDSVLLLQAIQLILSLSVNLLSSTPDSNITHIVNWD
jgi:hypothetical protein